MGKEPILDIKAEVETFEKARELLGELEVLVEKNEVSVTLVISSQVDFAKSYKLPI